MPNIFGYNYSFKVGPIVGVTRTREGNVIREFEILCDVEGVVDKEGFFAEFAKKARPTEIVTFIEEQLHFAGRWDFLTVRVWINLSPLFLSQREVRSALHALLIAKHKPLTRPYPVFDRVGFEIQETAHLSPYAYGFFDSIRKFYPLALDDVGSGKLANRDYVAELIRSLRPAKIKLDQSLLADRPADPVQAVALVEEWKDWLQSVTDEQISITLEGVPVNPTAWVLDRKKIEPNNHPLDVLVCAEPDLAKEWYEGFIKSHSARGATFQLAPVVM